MTYARASGGVTVSLGNSGPQNTGSYGFDTISGIENVTGSAFDDFLYGSSLPSAAGANVLAGGAGNDFIDGQSNRDELYGDSGDDILIGGYDQDYVDGGDGHDIARFIGRRADFVVTYDAATDVYTIADKRYANEVDKVTNVEVFRFSDGDVAVGDILDGNAEMVGDAGNNTLTGTALADTIRGLGGDVRWSRLFGQNFRLDKWIVRRG